MVHVQGKCSDERVNTVTNDVSVTNDSVKGKSVIVGSSNRFAVLVDMDPTQISSTSHVAGEASVETSGAGNDVLGQVAERVARQPREAAKAMARIVQDLKAQKQNKGGARKQNKGNKANTRALKSSEGVDLFSQEEIVGEVVRLFQDLLGSVDKGATGCDVYLFKGIFGCTFSNDAKSELSRHVTRDEVRAAIF
ncbi:hypothetical protein V6N11_055615 [Hibiscus sabdariffa]|uniref:Uncharacterized protein n=1 Tax=Hibiscus sabdariffa TaxID=183260 RepID=A0ABR2NR32_9ROSI